MNEWGPIFHRCKPIMKLRGFDQDDHVKLWSSDGEWLLFSRFIDLDASSLYLHSKKHKRTFEISMMSTQSQNSTAQSSKEFELCALSVKRCWDRLIPISLSRGRWRVWDKGKWRSFHDGADSVTLHAAEKIVHEALHLTSSLFFMFQICPLSPPSVDYLNTSHFFEDFLFFTPILSYSHDLLQNNWPRYLFFNYYVLSTNHHQQAWVGSTTVSLSPSQVAP